MREMLEQMQCTQCSHNDKACANISLDYQMANETDQKLYKSLPPCIDNEDETETDNENEIDNELTELQLSNHCYHLSWAVFRHLPCKYHHATSGKLNSTIN